MRILVRTGSIGQTIAVVVVVLHARALAQESPFMTRRIIAGGAPCVLRQRTD
jgi:hypothetical protein